jgi:hypothetical protein
VSLRAPCLAVALVALGCGPAPQVKPYDPSKPLELRKGEYLQKGEIVESRAVRADLGSDPRTKGHWRRADIMYGSYAATLIVGGGFLGWYLGGVIAEEPDPAWEAGVVGGALILTSVGLALWSIDSRHRAVKAHNAGLGSAGAPQAYYQLPESPFIVGPHSVGVTW